MSVTMPELAAFPEEPLVRELRVGQRVMVMQSLHELPSDSTQEELGPMVKKISQFEGTIIDLPDDTDTAHIGDRRDADGTPLPTYVAPLSPSRVGDKKAVWLLNFLIEPK